MAAVDFMVDDALDAISHDPGWQLLIRKLHHIPGEVIIEALRCADWTIRGKMPRDQSYADMARNVEMVRYSWEATDGEALE